MALLEISERLKKPTQVAQRQMGYTDVHELV